ncbi:MAG: hypothetical protein ABI477_22045 [Chryseolinea sp.]
MKSYLRNTLQYLIGAHFTWISLKNDGLNSSIVSAITRRQVDIVLSFRWWSEREPLVIMVYQAFVGKFFIDALPLNG